MDDILFDFPDFGLSDDESESELSLASNSDGEEEEEEKLAHKGGMWESRRDGATRVCCSY